MPGVVCWRKSLPIEKVGLYIPGGSAPLIFHRVDAGLFRHNWQDAKKLFYVTPPTKDGNIHPAILFTAQLMWYK